MKLPSQNSRAAVVLANLNRGPASVVDGILGHGDFGMKLPKVVELYEGLVSAGCAVQLGGVYALSLAARKYFDGLAVPAPMREEAAGPRFVKDWAPLSNRPRMVETRPGALAYRDVPSLMGGERVPYRSATGGDANGVA